MVTCCTYFIYRVAETYRRTPTLLAIDNTDYPVHRVRFPALTICNINKIDGDRAPPDQLRVLGRIMFNDTSEWQSRVMHVLEDIYATEVCDDGYCGDYSTAQQFSTKEVARIIELTSPPCDELLVTCAWRGAAFPCGDLFEQRHTDFGFCCVFNADWQDHQFSKKLYTASGESRGLTVLLDVQRNKYFYSQYLSVGLKVLVHAPYDMPEVRDNGLAISPGTETFIGITAEQMYTTAEAEQTFSPRERNCFTEHELTLPFSDATAYTLPNCLLSFATDATNRRCGCVAHYMPGNAKICHEKDLRCLRKTLADRTRNTTIAADAWRGCLPACDETKYVARLSSSEYPNGVLISHPEFQDRLRLILDRLCLALRSRQPPEWATASLGDMLDAVCRRLAHVPTSSQLSHTNLVSMLSNYTGSDAASVNGSSLGRLYSAAVRYAKENMILAHIYYSGNSITRYKRDVMYTKDQFVANIGGLLGLFLGFSIVSIFEIIYFFLIKLIPLRVVEFTVRPASASSSESQCHSAHPRVISAVAEQYRASACQK